MSKREIPQQAKNVMSVEIRQARPNDGSRIAKVKVLVWPDEHIDCKHITEAILDANHETFVATKKHEVIGFVDSFSTVSRQGVKRWEIDLLAVHPNHRGQRFGEHLVKASVDAGREAQAAIARALIRTENIASQKIFARCGYQKDSTVFNLYVSSNDVKKQKRLSHNLRVTPVQTFNYRGLWLEGNFTEDGFVAAQALRTSDGWDVVGAVIPAAQIGSNESAQGAGFMEVGQYQWWILDLGIGT